MTALILRSKSVPAKGKTIKPRKNLQPIELRPGQVKVKRELYDRIRDGYNRIQVVAPCGFGKTVLAASLVHDMTVRRDKKVLFLVHAKCLVEQTIDAFARYGLWCGAIAGGLQETRSKSIQVAMLQTLARGRDISWFKPDFVIADECHETLWSNWALRKFPRLLEGNEIHSLYALDKELRVLGIDTVLHDAVPTYEQVKAAKNKVAFENHPDQGGSTEAMQRINAAWQTIRDHRDLFESNRPTNAPKLIGLTATPWRLSKRQGMGDIFPVQVLGPTPGQQVELGIESGFTQGLVPFVYWRIPGADTKSVKIGSGRDFTEAELNEIGKSFSMPEIIQCAVDNYLSKAKGRSFACFPTSIRHAQLLHHAFNKAGIKCALVTGSTSNKHRQIIYQEIRDGYLNGVISVGCLCLDDQTEILTKQGWVAMGDMTFEHDVANWAYDHIFFDKPQDIVVRDRKPHEKMVIFKSRSVDLRVTENHDMVTTNQYDAPRKRFKKVKAIDCVGKQAGLPVCGVAEPDSIVIPSAGVMSEKEYSRRVSANAYNYRKHHGMSHPDSIAEAKKRIESRVAITHKNPNELTLSDCRLIGFWIGDGTVTKGKSGSTCYKLAQSINYPKINEWIESNLSESSIHYTKHLNDGSNNSAQFYTYHLSLGTGFGNQSRAGIFPITPYLTKSSNNLFWGFNEAQFDAFIEGLWMADGFHGDGTIKENYQFVIGGTELDLLSQLQAIAVCRGYKAMLTGGAVKTRPKSKDYYRLRLKKQAWTIVGGGQEKETPYIEDGFKQEKVWCVSVKSQNIIVRRNGCVAVVGNSIGFDLPEISCIIDCCPTMSKAKFVQAAGRGQRLAPWINKKDCVYLDQAGNVGRHGMIEDITYGSLTKADETPAGEAPVKECPECGHIMHSFLMTCSNCGYEFPVPKKEMAVGDMVLLVRDGEEDLFEGFQELVRQAYVTGKAPSSAVYQANEVYKNHPAIQRAQSKTVKGKPGTWYPRKEWYYHAVFEKPCLEDTQAYMKYLQACAAKYTQPKPQWWFDNQMKREFGENWQSLPSDPTYKHNTLDLPDEF